MAEDLRVDTSPEVLGAVGSRLQPHHPAYYWPGNSSMITQGAKRPLMNTNRGNQLPLQEQVIVSDRTVTETHKVRASSPSTVNLCTDISRS